jgi:hypothetical protein
MGVRIEAAPHYPTSRADKPGAAIDGPALKSRKSLGSARAEKRLAVTEGFEVSSWSLPVDPGSSRKITEFAIVFSIQSRSLGAAPDGTATLTPRSPLGRMLHMLGLGCQERPGN